jgi:hypothetical protein
MSQYTDYFNNNITHEYALMLDENSPQGFAQPTRTSNSTYTSSANWTYTQFGTHVETVNDGFIPGQKCWKVRLSSTSGTFARYRSTVTSYLNLYSDNSFSAGVWFNAEQIPNSAGAGVPFYGVRPATRGFLFSIYYDTNTNKNTLLIPIGDKVKNYTSDNYPSLTTNTWNYVAIRRDGANAYIYLNGQLIDTDTNVAINTTATMVGVDIGNTANLYTQDIKIASPYVAEFNSITATEIANIYNAAIGVIYSSTAKTASVDIVHPSIKTDTFVVPEVITCDATFLHPTISTMVGDNAYTTTHFEASALFPSDVSITNNVNLNITITETLNASAELINNVGVSTGSNVSYGSVELTASAEFVEPSVSRAPMTVSALMVNPTIFVTPSYFKMIIEDNPVFYTNLDQTTITNYGSWGANDNEVIGSTISKEVTSPGKMASVGEGDSWQFTGTYNNAPNYVRIYGPDAETTANLLNGNFSVEYWFYKTNTNSAGVGGKFGNIQLIYRPSNDGFVVVVRNVDEYALPFGGTSTTRRYYSSAGAVIDNNWNNVILTKNGKSFTLWVNGSPILASNFQAPDWYNSYVANPQYLSVVSSQFDETQDDEASSNNASALVDEFAIYNRVLTNSEIIDHFSFINNLDPNNEFIAVPFYANTQTVNHQFLVISNADTVATPITASADFIMPSILTTTNINYSVSALTASALNTNVIVYYGWTIYADPTIASAESKEGFALNTTYSDYIQANITPYRYVTFDTATPYSDSGTDNDYSVAATVVGGTIVNPDLGINGKSAKTAGTSYITDGVILKESEHDDNWGTGNNSWHSSFWMERATDDASTTGLRVLWNLNGHNDNQNIILYHYQNKLHLQINNQVGAPITITSANNVNVFDYTRHNIVINSHHNNNKNHLYVYVDAVLVLDQDINTYAVTTINNPIHVGANDEANNFPRLGIGCLITPFGDTALPVVPTNTKLILDEIYWDKNQILQTAVTNIFNVMPDKTNTNNATVALTASAEMSMPAIITNAILSAAPATASGQFVHPSLYLVRLVNVTANVMEASALMAEATGFVPVNIVSDVMVASAAFNTSLVATTVPGPTMYASAKLTEDHKLTYYTGAFSNTILVQFNKIYSTYVRYLVYKANNDNKIPRYREVK